MRYKPEIYLPLLMYEQWKIEDLEVAGSFDSVFRSLLCLHGENHGRQPSPFANCNKCNAHLIERKIS